MAATQYAHAINNISTREGEVDMYKHMTTGESGSGATQKSRYFVLGTYGNQNYRDFRNIFRKNLDAAINFNGKDYKARMARIDIAATIGVQLGTISDPSGGADFWAGGKSTMDYVKHHSKMGTTIYEYKQTTEGGYTSYNIFYQMSKAHTEENNNVVDQTLPTPSAAPVQSSTQQPKQGGK